MAKSKFRQALQKQGGSGALLKRTQESFNSRESSGKYKSYLADLPRPQWIAKEGDHIIDIVPFLAGSKHPKAKPGEPVYLVDLWVHRKVGITEDNMVCPALNYGKKCFICEELERRKRAENLSEADEAWIKERAAKRRVIYNVMVYDNAEEEAKGVQIWEESHWFAEKNISAVARNRRTGAFIPFSDPDEGKSIEFGVSGKGMGKKFEGFTLSDRPEGGEVTDAMLEEAISIDDYIEIKTYDEMKIAFLGIDGDEESDEEVYDDEVPATTSARGRGRVAQKEEDPDDDYGPEDDNCHEEEAEEEQESEEEAEEEAEEEQEEEKPARSRGALGRNTRGRGTVAPKEEDPEPEQAEKPARGSRTSRTAGRGSRAPKEDTGASEAGSAGSRRAPRRATRPRR